MIAIIILIGSAITATILMMVEEPEQVFFIILLGTLITVFCVYCYESHLNTRAEIIKLQLEDDYTISEKLISKTIITVLQDEEYIIIDNTTKIDINDGTICKRTNKWYPTDLKYEHWDEMIHIINKVKKIEREEQIK